MTLRPLSWLFWLIFLAGCGGMAPSPPPLEIGPHQGRLVKLPDGAGVAEIVVETVRNSPRSASYELAAYFYQSDAKTPMVARPSDVVVQVYNAESKTLERVALKPAGESISAGKFAGSPPPGFDGMMRSGRLAARVEGRDLDLPF